MCNTSGENVFRMEFSAKNCTEMRNVVEYIWRNLFSIVEMINYIMAYWLIFQIKPKKGIKNILYFLRG